MIHGVILTDNTFNNDGITAGRGAGAHKIATHLRKYGYNIEVVDYCISWSQLDYTKLFSKVITSDTLFLGIGSNLFLDQDNFNKSIHWFKEQYPQVKIILGGNQVLTRSIPCVDYYVEGYAENAILVLLDYLRGRVKETSIKWTDNPEGLKFINATTDYGPVDTTDLSIDYLPSDFIRPEQTLGLETARGCIFACKFCTYPLLGKKKLDYIRNPQTIADELQRNYDQWGVTNYLINEDTFNDSIEKLELIASAVSKLSFKINFTAYARLDLILAKPRSVELLRSIGLKGIHFGIETFSKPAAKLIGKGLSGSKAKDGLLWFKEQMPEVTTVCSMIVGIPGDTSDYREENEWFAQSGIDNWYWQPLYITKADQTIHTSEISRDSSQFGLDLMSNDEVAKELKRLWILESKYRLKRHPISYMPFIEENFRSKVGYWKNNDSGENYFTCMELSQELNHNRQNLGMNPWAMFDYVSLGYNLDHVQKWKSKPPRAELISRADERLQEYKNKKIAYNYSSAYNVKKDIKRIIQIESVNYAKQD
jgi:radical SAM superfamily enzyme YgiQ (UPF0313 family)